MKNIKGCILLLMLLLAISILTSCKVHHDTTYMPDYEEERNIVWISKDPEMYITRTTDERGFSYEVCGGQMKIDGELQEIAAGFDPGSFGEDFFAFSELYYWDEEDGRFKEMVAKSFFCTQVEYTAEKMICSVYKNNTNLKIKKIEFFKYNKDEVKPSDFNFSVEKWDDFVNAVHISQ